jgi:formyltetrahydrofolate synthetase
VAMVKRIAEQAGAYAAIPSNHWTEGGAGAVELAEAVVDACEQPSNFDFLYPLNLSIKEKIETIAAKVYGADGVDYTPLANQQIAAYEKAGFGELPMCMAKTHLSLSHDPAKKGVPTGFVLPVREVRASVGAGFIYPLCGEMRTMPGLPSRPVFLQVDLDDDGKVVGLF